MPFVPVAPEVASSVQIHVVAEPVRKTVRGQVRAPRSACAECLRRRAATRAAFVDKEKVVK